MPRLPIPSDTDEFSNETRAAVRHIRETRKSMPPPSSYTPAGPVRCFRISSTTCATARH